MSFPGLHFIIGRPRVATNRAANQVPSETSSAPSKLIEFLEKNPLEKVPVIVREKTQAVIRSKNPLDVATKDDLILVLEVLRHAKQKNLKDNNDVIDNNISPLIDTQINNILNALNTQSGWFSNGTSVTFGAVLGAFITECDAKFETGTEASTLEQMAKIIEKKLNNLIPLIGEKEKEKEYIRIYLKEIRRTIYTGIKRTTYLGGTDYSGVIKQIFPKHAEIYKNLVKLNNLSDKELGRIVALVHSHKVGASLSTGLVHTIKTPNERTENIKRLSLTLIDVNSKTGQYLNYLLNLTSEDLWGAADKPEEFKAASPAPTFSSNKAPTSPTSRTSLAAPDVLSSSTDTQESLVQIAPNEAEKLVDDIIKLENTHNHTDFELFLEQEKSNNLEFGFNKEINDAILNYHIINQDNVRKTEAEKKELLENKQNNFIKVIYGILVKHSGLLKDDLAAWKDILDKLNPIFEKTSHALSNEDTDNANIPNTEAKDFSKISTSLASCSSIVKIKYIKQQTIEAEENKFYEITYENGDKYRGRINGKEQKMRHGSGVYYFKNETLPFRASFKEDKIESIAASEVEKFTQNATPQQHAETLSTSSEKHPTGSQSSDGTPKSITLSSSSDSSASQIPSPPDSPGGNASSFDSDSHLQIEGLQDSDINKIFNYIYNFIIHGGFNKEEDALIRSGIKNFGTNTDQFKKDISKYMTEEKNRDRDIFNFIQKQCDSRKHIREKNATSIFQEQFFEHQPYLITKQTKV